MLQDENLLLIKIKLGTDFGNICYD